MSVKALAFSLSRREILNISWEGGISNTPHGRYTAMRMAQAGDTAKHASLLKSSGLWSGRKATLSQASTFRPLSEEMSIKELVDVAHLRRHSGRE